jgi:L-lactate utilization protein LutB
MKLVRKQPVTDQDIENALYEVCCDEHSSCGNGCPVYEKYGDEMPDNCPFFKNGHEMLKFLRNKKEHL